MNKIKIPALIMLQGLPGCGKTKVAQKYIELAERPTKVHSLKAVWAELYGDRVVQPNLLTKCYREIHSRIKNDLRNGFDVIYDAPNIKKSQRYGFIQELKGILCIKYCICIVTPYEVCLKTNSENAKKLSEDVIKEMYMNWQPPDFSDGFDDIDICYFAPEHTDNDWTIKSLASQMRDFDQENEHHKFTLGNHCLLARNYINEMYPDNHLLAMAAYLHDNGKIFTKTKDGDRNSHYYQHHSVGAYNSMLYLINEDFSTQEIIYISNLIYYHMHPYTSWKQSEKSEAKCRRRIGEEMFTDIKRLNEADIFAH